MGKSGVRHVGEMGAVGEINTGEHDDLAARAEAVHLDEKLWKKAGGGDRERLGERGGGERGGENGGGRTGEICHVGETARVNWVGSNCVCGIWGRMGIVSDRDLTRVRDVRWCPYLRWCRDLRLCRDSAV